MNIPILRLLVFTCARYQLVLMFGTPIIFWFSLFGLRLLRNQLACLMQPLQSLSHSSLDGLLPSISHSVCFVNSPIVGIYYEPSPIVEGVDEFRSNHGTVLELLFQILIEKLLIYETSFGMGYWDYMGLMVESIEVKLEKTDQELAYRFLIWGWFLVQWSDYFNITFETHIFLNFFNGSNFSDMIGVFAAHEVFLISHHFFSFSLVNALQPRKNALVLKVCNRHQYNGVRDKHFLVRAETLLVPLFQ